MGMGNDPMHPHGDFPPKRTPNVTHAGDSAVVLVPGFDGMRHMTMTDRSMIGQSTSCFKMGGKRRKEGKKERNNTQMPIKARFFKIILG